jgi:hypothetical protein
MTLSFIPGRRANIKKLYNYNIYKDYSTCTCIQEKVNQVKTGWNDPLQNENLRISQILSNNLGGKIQWGNFGISAKVNYLGKVEGQPGGGEKPLRNRF